MDLLKEFEKVIKDRTVVFNHDKEDGFWIEVTEKGKYKKDFNVADLEHRIHDNIEGAIKASIDYIKKEESDFENVFKRNTR